MGREDAVMFLFYIWYVRRLQAAECIYVHINVNELISAKGSGRVIVESPDSEYPQRSRDWVTGTVTYAVTRE